jgi:hypothetical protein
MHFVKERASGGGQGVGRYVHTNRHGVRFHVRAIRDRRGRHILVMGTAPEGALQSLPPGYEVRENVHGHVSIRRKGQSRIRMQEEWMVRACVGKLKPFAHAVGAEDSSITIYASSLDRKCLAGSLDAEFAEGFASALNDALGRCYGGELVEMFRANRRSSKDRKARFYPLIRFRLKDRRRRTFFVERVCFSGDKSWLVLGVMSLPAALMKYVPHLGRDTLFDMI